MAEYLRTMEPILTPQQFSRMQMVINEFTSGIGPSLHQYLAEKRDAEDNWVSYQYRL